MVNFGYGYCECPRSFYSLDGYSFIGYSTFRENILCTLFFNSHLLYIDKRGCFLEFLGYSRQVEMGRAMGEDYSICGFTFLVAGVY
jgi:hypothetical protein